MNHQRRVLLSLLAAGRITAAEAERLTLAWEAPAWPSLAVRSLAWQNICDWVWIVVFCIAACLLQRHPPFATTPLANLLHGFVDYGTTVLHTAASSGTTGGRV